MNEIVTGWIDGVPSTWDCYKIGACFSLGSGTTPPTSEPHWYDGNVPWIQTSELREKLIREHSRSVSEAATKQFSALRVYKLGAIAVAMYGATIGRVGMLGIDATTNQACCVLSERLWLTKEFVFWWFQGIRDRLIERGNGGGQPNISQSVISGLRLYAPRKKEQQHIAAWLDLQTNRIDNRRELLGKKRELLRDLKKAITEEATFLGLAGGVVLRDSEIDWLGKVPAHWTTLRLGSLFREAADAGIEGLPMLSVSLHTGITDKELDDDEMERKVSRSEDRTLYKRVKPGDLVYNQMAPGKGHSALLKSRDSSARLTWWPAQGAALFPGSSNTCCAHRPPWRKSVGGRAASPIFACACTGTSSRTFASHCRRWTSRKQSRLSSTASCRRSTGKSR